MPEYNLISQRTSFVSRQLETFCGFALPCFIALGKIENIHLY